MRDTAERVRILSLLAASPAAAALADASQFVGM